MEVAFKVGPMYYEIGAGSFMYSFFSTVAQNLEKGNWGSRFPYLMDKLFNKALVKNKDIPKLENEVSVIKKEFGKFSPNQVVWDFNDLTKRPPWGNDIADTITNLSNYFVTSDGEDFFDVFYRAINDAKEINMDIELNDMDFPH